MITQPVKFEIKKTNKKQSNTFCFPVYSQILEGHYSTHQSEYQVKDKVRDKNKIKTKAGCRQENH